MSRRLESMRPSVFDVHRTLVLGSDNRVSATRCDWHMSCPSNSRVCDDGPRDGIELVGSLAAPI